MEEMLMETVRDDVISIIYHPVMLSSLIDPSSMAKLGSEEEYVAGALASRLKKDCAIQAGDSTSAARAMGGFIVDEVDDSAIDIVLAALRHVCLLLSTIFSHYSSPLSSVSGDCYKPLLDKAIWRQRFLCGDLDEGTPLAKQLQDIFQATIKHHKALLDACLPSPPTRSAIPSPCWILCTDFDDTCTTLDTTSVLVGIAGKQERWYTLMEGVCMNMERCSLKGDLRSCLRALEAFEKELDQQVLHEALLKGISREGIRKASGEHVSLRKSCAQVLSRNDQQLHIISSNWSQDLIRHVLPLEIRDRVAIHSNDLSFDDEGICDGGIKVEVQDSFDKERVVSSIRSENAGGKTLVYIGDSINDLLALLEADVGIVMGENSMLQEVLVMHKIELLPLPIAAAQFLAGTPTSFSKSGKLFQASDWSEIARLLS